MSNRFDSLNDGTTTSQKKYKSNTESKGNVFKQPQSQSYSKKPERNYQTQENVFRSKKSSGRGRNGEIINKKKEFSVEISEFPAICEAKIAKNNMVYYGYIDNILRNEDVSINKDKKTNLTILKKGLFLPKSDEKKNISIYYSPLRSQKILEDRYSQREELNEIVGDISQYWNIDEELDNYDDYDDYEDEWSEDEDLEYCEDW